MAYKCKQCGYKFKEYDKDDFCPSCGEPRDDLIEAKEYTAPQNYQQQSFQSTRGLPPVNPQQTPLPPHYNNPYPQNQIPPMNGNGQIPPPYFNRPAQKTSSGAKAAVIIFVIVFMVIFITIFAAAFNSQKEANENFNSVYEYTMESFDFSFPDSLVDYSDIILDHNDPVNDGFTDIIVEASANKSTY